MAFISLTQLTKKLNLLHVSLNADGSSENHRNLRGPRQKKEREEFQAWLFMTAYADHFSLKGMSVQMEEEYSAHDITVRWFERGRPQYLKIQLKELPPERLNAISVSDFLLNIVKKPMESKDITLAIMGGRRKKEPSKVEMPEHKFSGVWWFGISNIKPMRFFLSGYDSSGRSRNFTKRS